MPPAQSQILPACARQSDREVFSAGQPDRVSRRPSPGSIQPPAKPASPPEVPCPKHLRSRTAVRPIPPAIPERSRLPLRARACTLTPQQIQEFADEDWAESPAAPGAPPPFRFPAPPFQSASSRSAAPLSLKHKRSPYSPG